MPQPFATVYMQSIFLDQSLSYYKEMGSHSILLFYKRSLKHMQSFDFIPKP